MIQTSASVIPSNRAWQYNACQQFRYNHKTTGGNIQQPKRLLHGAAVRGGGGGFPPSRVGVEQEQRVHVDVVAAGPALALSLASFPRPPPAHSTLASRNPALGVASSIRPPPVPRSVCPAWTVHLSRAHTHDHGSWPSNRTVYLICRRFPQR